MHTTVLHHSDPDGTFYEHKECPIYAAFQDGAVHKVENEVFWRKDGTSFFVEYTSTPVWSRDTLIGAVVVFRDVTQRRDAKTAYARRWTKCSPCGSASRKRTST